MEFEGAGALESDHLIRTWRSSVMRFREVCQAYRPVLVQLARGVVWFLICKTLQLVMADQHKV